ncbi:AAA family ATPase [Streptomyces sp. NPDC101206]|uniref:helix-turn-helix transcriptional regulator n=1 Tax=Streptomyces sp. NPDC101206 TaxID=3366128 RepID=UPI00380740B6
MLTGRQQELAVLAELTRPDAPATAVVVQGGRGTGKSALLGAALRRAVGEGGLVLSAMAEPADAHTRSGLVRQLVEQLPSPRAGRPGGLGGPGPAAGEEAHRLIAAAARRAPRTVLGIDDLQWTDAASAAWLETLLRRLDDLPVTVVATHGPGRLPSDDDPVGTLLPLFHRRIRLTPLTDADVARLVRTVLGTGAEDGTGAGPEPAPEFVTACRTATGGNPALLHALLRSLRSAAAAPDAATAAALDHHVPAGTGRTVHAALRTMGPGVLATAEAAAVLVGPHPPAAELLAFASGIEQHVVEDGLHALTLAGTMVPGAHGSTFSAPLLAAAVAAEVLPSRRQALHSRAARFLIDQGAAWAEVVPHLLGSPIGQDGTAEALLNAADDALEHGENATAVACLRRALREPLREQLRAQVLASLGEAELARCVPTAVHTLRRSLDLATVPGEQAAAARSLAGALFTLDRYPEGLDVLRRAAQRIRHTGPAHALRLEIDLLYGQLGRIHTAAAALPRLRELDPAAAQGSPAERSLAALLSLRCLLDDGGCREDALAHARDALAGGVCPEGDESYVYTAPVLAFSAAGRPDLALAHVNASLEGSRGQAAALRQAYLTTLRAGINYRLGDVRGCEADARAAIAALRGVGAGPTTSHSVAMLTDALTKQGRLAEAEDLLSEHGLAGTLGQHWANDFTALVRGRLKVARGRVEEGLEDLLRAGERATTRLMSGPAVLPWRSEAALARVALGDTRQAVELAAEEAELARAWGAPEITGNALRVLGLVTPGPDGLALLHEAVALLEPTAARLAHAQALADCGARLRQAGHLDDARAHLRSAVVSARRCGATAVADAAECELRAAGYRPDAPAEEGAQALTPSERRVAALAAEGLTNKEIAARLYVGLRTVEVHLTKAYGKLGIQGRPGLADALAAPGSVRR